MVWRNKDFLTSKVPLPLMESVHCLVRGMLDKDHGNLERENTSLFRDVLWMPT